MPSERARNNRTQLFGAPNAPLAETDPELSEIFDNFAFDQVLGDSDLPVRARLMVQLAALIGSDSTGQYRIMLAAALRAELSPGEVKEVVYQTVPYVGIGRATEFLTVTNDVLVESGVTLPRSVTTTSHSGLATRQPVTRYC